MKLLYSVGFEVIRNNDQKSSSFLLPSYLVWTENHIMLDMERTLKIILFYGFILPVRKQVQGGEVLCSRSWSIFSKIAVRLFRWVGQVSFIEILLLRFYLVMEIGRWD